MPRKIFENHTELPYHVTARCINRDWFAQDQQLVWEIMTRNLYFVTLAFGIRVHAFVLMNNHFHMIVQTPHGNLSQAMQYFLRATGNDLREISGRINQTFGGRFHRSLLATPRHYLHAYKYLYRNPVQAGMCERVEDYPYSTLQGILGVTRIEIPVFDDWNWGNYRSREQTLQWLNATPAEEHWEAVRKALRRGVFTLPKSDSRPSPLEDCAL